MAGLLKVPQRGRERVYCTYHCSIYTSLDMLTSHPQLSPVLRASLQLPFPSSQCTTLYHFTLSHNSLEQTYFFFLSHGRATPSVFLSSWCRHSLTLKAGFSYNLFISVLVWILPEADSDIQGFCVIVY